VPKGVHKPADLLKLPATMNNLYIFSREAPMKTRSKFLDYSYEEVLDVKTRELIRVGCAVAVGCPD
jgi:alkylhydroperoxidase/carboxymuconolactone decarboxylase family protein YurZ